MRGVSALRPCGSGPGAEDTSRGEGGRGRLCGSPGINLRKASGCALVACSSTLVTEMSGCRFAHRQSQLAGVRQLLVRLAPISAKEKGGYRPRACCLWQQIHRIGSCASASGGQMWLHTSPARLDGGRVEVELEAEAEAEMEAEVEAEAEAEAEGRDGD